METSQRTSQIQIALNQPGGRIEAIVRTHWWSVPGDPTRPVPLDALAWAVAANPAVQDAVKAQEQIDNGNNAILLGLAKVSDDTLASILLDPGGALERLDAA